MKPLKPTHVSGSPTLTCKDAGYSKYKLTKQEEIDCFARWRAGDADAHNTLVYSMGPLVVTIARRICFKPQYLDDCISAGYVGLLQALEKFDPTLGWRLSTYAYKAVQRHVLKEIHHVPTEQLDEFNEPCDKHVAQVDLTDHVDLGILDVRARYCVEQHYLLGKKCAVLGDEFNVTRSQISWVIREAIKELRRVYCKDRV